MLFESDDTYDMALTVTGTRIRQGERKNVSSHVDNQPQHKPHLLKSGERNA